MNPQIAEVLPSNCTGVVHVGGSVGQERDIYQAKGLDVLWFEPIPISFHHLKTNISAYPKQRAFQLAATDEDDKTYEFYVTSNMDSSSLLHLAEHRSEWSHISCTQTIQVAGITLDTFFKRNSFNPFNFQALVLDTQGSELKVLKGATELLSTVQFIEVEVADFEIYTGCALLEEMQIFMDDRGFNEKLRITYPCTHIKGNCYEIVYGR